MKRLLLLFSILTTLISVTWAQIPEGYYQVYGGSMSHIYSWTPEYAKPGDIVTITESTGASNFKLKVYKVSGELNNLYEPISTSKVEGEEHQYTFVMPTFDYALNYVEVSGEQIMLQPVVILSKDLKTLTLQGVEPENFQQLSQQARMVSYASYQQEQMGNHQDDETAQFVADCQNNVESVVIEPSMYNVGRMQMSQGGARMFNGFSILTSISGIDNLNMRNFTSTQEMFAGCSSLASLTIGSNFYVPEKGISPYGEEFEFNANDMFKGCDALENGTLTVKGTTPPVIEQYIFTCFTQGTLMTDPKDLLDYSVMRDNMGNVYYWGGMFTRFNSTAEPYVTLSDDSKTLTFAYGEKPEQGQSWDITDDWNSETKGTVTNVVFDSSFKSAPVTSCEGWFSGFTKLTTVDATYLNTSRCTSTKEMFADCSSLNDLTIGDNFFIGQADTYNTTDMFKGCTAMASGTVTIVNTSPASGMYPIINQDIFSVITNGTLMTGNGVDLSTYVEEKDDGFRCLGGIFTTYNDKQILTIRLADPTKAASKDNPYIINNVDDMVILSKAVNAGEDWTKNTWIKIATANEIFDFDGITGFEPIGTSTNKFTSSFDGNGVTIKNLNLSGTTNTGAFGYASGGWTHTIENIRIDNSSSFASSGNYLGSLAGYAEGITINNCHNDGATVTASGTATEVGGLIGYMLSGTISDCSSNANVSGYTDVGGLMGHAGYGNGKVEMYNNTVGMALAKDEAISITATAGAIGAMVGSVNTCSGTGNYYNGQAITAKQGAKELTGYGFGVNQTDNAYIMSATGGLFATMNPGHTGKTLTWSYDLYSKAFTIIGSPDPGYELTSVTISYKDANGDVQKLVRNKEQLDESWAFEVQNYPTNVEATCETALKLADPTQPASKENPYLINNVQDMVTLAKAVNVGTAWIRNTWFKVAKENDVFDFDGITDFEPIGTSTNKFTSRFDGNGVTIKNLNLTGNEYVGLFGCAYYTTYTQKSEISNITIDSSCSFTANTNYAGAFVASTNYTDIINCHNMGATVIATTSYAGGIVAQAGAGTNISGCTSNANVTAKSYAGGIAGSASATTMTNNLVGIDLAEGETITINCSQGGGAIVSYINNVQGSNNFYNGMAVILNAFNTTYQGQGYAYWRSDNDVLRSATEGYFPAITGHQAKSLTWNYNLYTKAFTINGAPDPGYELTSVTVSYKDANGDVQKLVRSKEELDNSWTFDVQNYPTNVEAICETALKLADPTQPASKENPYLINNVNDMVTLSKAVNANQSFTKNTWFKVAKENDVFDFDGITDFEPIGTSMNKFTSRFDGNGVAIKNLRLTGDEYVGLFGCAYYTTYTEKSKISNITIDASCSFTANTSNAGAFVASTNYTDVINCHNMGATVIATTSYAGGIVAQAGAGTTISGCTSKANVTAKSYAGGIAGSAYATTMTNNLVGIDLAEGETITINCSQGGGAIVSYINNVQGSDNFYNGMAVILNAFNTTYQGQGYAYWRSDNDVLKSATRGYFPAVTGHQGKGLTWDYNLYTKTFNIIGTPDPGYELTSVTISYKDTNGDVQELVRSKEQLDESWTFEVQNYPTNVETICETALKLADPTQPASKDNPYLINNVNDMVTLSKAVNANQSFTKNTWFKVAKENDVFDFDGITDFEPIGKSTSDYTKFTSRFDGNGVTIKNLKLTGNEYVGLFGCGYYTTTTSYVKSEISNITIDASCSFTANTNYAGAIVAITNYTDIINCHNMGATVIATTSYAGGIVAQAGAGSTISGCTSKANVTSNWYAGGIAGLVSYATMTNNLVGMCLEEDETITINCSNGGGAIVSNINNVSGSDNFYNGTAVILNSKNTTYQGQGYAYWRSDNDFLKSATGGYCGVTSENSGNNVEWKYDLYTKDFTVFGTGGTADYTTSMAPSIVKDEIETLTISEGVTGIGAKAFSGCTNLNTVIFDGCTLTSAASDAFDGCTAMAEGTVIINKAIPIGDGVGTDFLSIVTNGSLKCDATSNLKAEVERQGDTFLWKGGTFGTYQQELTIADINFGENKFWTTYYSDENITTPDGVTAFVVSDIEDNTVTVSSIDYIPANVGVLLYSETSGSIQKSYLFTGSEQNYNSMLEGSLDGMTLTKEAGYILLNNEFVLTSGGQLAAHRCYLPIAKRSNKILARVMSIGWGSQTGTTDIENINSDDKTTDDHWYTLDGRKLDKVPVRKGLYIHGRRKVIVK